MSFRSSDVLNTSLILLQTNEIDELRFDIVLNDDTWSLRAFTVEECKEWLECLGLCKEVALSLSSPAQGDSDYGSLGDNNSTYKRHHRNSSSLLSNTFSEGSNESSSGRICWRNKMSELETYKDLLLQQINEVQLTIQDTEKAQILHDHSLIIKETSQAFIDLMVHLYSSMNKRENPPVKNALNRIKDEEYFDAAEVTLDKMEKQGEESENGKDVVSFAAATAGFISPGKHHLSQEIESVLRSHLDKAFNPDTPDKWELILNEDSMSIYRKDGEEDGFVCDPFKAVALVHGITAHEVCHYFFDPKYRYDWETTLETMIILEEICHDTFLFHQFHTRIWPAAQRDSCFWSHIRAVKEYCNANDEHRDIWIVCNHSTHHPLADPKDDTNKCVRVKLSVSLICETLIDPPPKDQSISRNNISCKIIYSSRINPGGWLPVSALRALSKREYPRFMKKFIAYVESNTKDKPLLF